MAETTAIEWTDSTFNPWIGCTNISPACDHCYAETWNARFDITEWGPHGARRRTSQSAWKNPLKWRAEAHRFLASHGRRRRVFCGSLCDIFDNQAPQEYRDDLFRLIRPTPSLDWQLLTKRPQNIGRFLPDEWGCFGYPNVWLGSSMENQEYFEQRWRILCEIPAVIRFVSYEPALGPLRLPFGVVPDWIICGGESGPRARTMDPQWARDLRDDCLRRGVAYFHKQWGSYPSNPLCYEQRMTTCEAEALDGKANGKGGALLDGRLWRQFPS